MKRLNNKIIAASILGCALIYCSCTKEPVATTPTDTLERKIIDTAYGSDPKQKMDIYLPKGRSSSTKVVILIHGGAWQAGDKSEMSFLVPMIQAKWSECAIVNINYRLANGSTVIAKDIMNDLKSAVKFIGDNKANFNISDNYAMVGASAGGQLALLYTYTENTDNRVKCVSDLYGPCVIDDWSWYNSFNIFLGKSIKEVLTTYTGTTWEADSNAYHKNSPYRQLNAANAKPTIIFHGTVDVIVPLYQSQWLSAKLKTLGVKNEYYEYPLDGHGFNSTNNQDCVNRTVSFFKGNM